MTAPRVIACTVVGFVLGILFWFIALITGMTDLLELTPGLSLGMLFNYGFIGFAIGVAGWKTKWAFRGVVIGLVGSLAMAARALDWADGLRPFLLVEFAGGVCGLLIELAAAVLNVRFQE